MRVAIQAVLYAVMFSAFPAIAAEVSVTLPDGFEAQPNNDPPGMENYSLTLGGVNHNLSFHADRQAGPIAKESCTAGDDACLVHLAVRELNLKIIVAKAMTSTDRPGLRNLDTRFSEVDQSAFPHDLCRGLSFYSVLSPDVKGRVKTKFYIRGTTVFCSFFAEGGVYWTTGATVSENASSKETLLPNEEFERLARNVLSSLQY